MEEENTSTNINTSPIDPKKRKSSFEKPKIKNSFDKLGKAYSNNLYYNTGYGNSKYDKNFNFDAQFNELDPLGSINENRSQEQGIWNTVGAGLGRVGTKVTTELVKTGAAIVGTVGGLTGNTIDLITGEDKTDFLEVAFNNDFIKAAEKIQKSVNEEFLPVYVSDTVTNGNFLDKVTSSEFWATDGADGVGYLISAMAPGAAFKGLGLGSKIFGGVSKLTALRYGKNVETARRFLTKAGLTIDKIDSFAIPAVNTYFEAGAEAKGAGDAIESRKPKFLGNYKMNFDQKNPEFIQKVSSKMEALDLDRRSGIISDIEYNLLSQNISEETVSEMAESAFKEQKGRAMRNTFLTNLAVLAGPNYIQAKLLYGKNPSKIMLDKITGQAVESSVKNTVKQGLKRVGQSFLSEGSEEVAQTSTEHRNVNNALQNKLGEYAVNDFDPFTFGKDFIETLGTTEGQVAGFLGGILGAPISIVGGYKQDVADNERTERLRAKINGQSTALDDIYNTNLYEQEEYVNPETNETLLRDKEVNGKKVLIPENVAKVKKALDLQEALSQVYDQAIQDADTDTLEALKKQAEFNIISNFIGEEEVTLDALNEHLKTIFPVTEKTQDGSELSKEQIKQNTENKNRISDVITKAKVLQKDLLSFKDMSQSLIRLNNKNATPKQIEEFLNGVGNAFLSERAEEFDVKQKLAKLEKDRAELIKDLPLESKGFFKSNSQTLEDAEKLDKVKEAKTDENGFSFLTDNEIYKNNPRLNFINKQIETAKNQLEEYNKTTNELIWNNEFLNKQFDAKIKEDSEVREALSEENVVKNNEHITKIKEATTAKEIEAVEKTTKNPIVKEKAATKKAEITEAEKAASEEKIATATQEDNDFNDSTNYDSLIGTEGSTTSDELTPKDNENNSTEELKSIKNDEVNNGKGVRVISTNTETGEKFSFVSEEYLKYERNPVDKIGNEVKFEVNQNPGKNPKVLEALDAFNNKDFSNPKLLIDYLSINVKFAKSISAPIDTRKITGKIDFSTELLRIELINNLINGVDIKNMSTTVQGQYKGLLKVDDNKLANNNILQLDGVKDLKYVRENLHVVNSFGKLQNILTGKTLDFNDGRVKENAKGEIYLMISQANGTPFPLKLNIKKINEAEASLLYYIYREIITNDKALNTTISEISNDLKEAIETSFKAELDIIGGNKNDIKLQEIIDLLIYQSDNVKSRMQINNGIIYFGQNQSTIDTIDDDMNSIIDYLVSSKRHQIKIDKKFDTDNEKTNLKSNSVDYLKYLIDNLILSTNAVVNEPTFQGYTNIYLNTGVTINNQSKISESGVEINSNNFESLDFNNQSQITTTELQLIVSDNEVEINAKNSGLDTLFEKESFDKNIKKEIIKNQINNLPDNLMFITHITSNNNSKNIFDSSLLMPAGVSSTTGIVDKTKLLDILNNLIDGKSPHRGYLDMFIGVIDKSTLENSKGKTLQDKLENYLDDNFIEDVAKTQLPSKLNFGYFTNEVLTLKNNSENVRNSQESFVPLSEIQGTMENTELKETQTEVFKEVISVPSATEMRLLNKAATIFNNNPENLTDSQRKRLEEAAVKYPETYKKLCK
jgi:hypothetical protein